MKKNLMSMGLLALCFVLMSSFAMAVPVLCSSIAPGTNVSGIDCVANGLEFSNFQYSVAGGVALPNPAEIDWAGISTSGGWTLVNFNPNLAFPSLITDLHFTFLVQNANNQLGVGSSNVFGAALLNSGLLSSIQEHNCAGNGTGLNDCTGTLIWNTGDLDQQSSSCVGSTGAAPAANNLFPGSLAGTNGTCAYSGAGQNQVAVWKDINLASTAGHQSSLTEGFLTNPGVPEPMTLSLMGAGLLGLGLLRRRMKQ